MKLALLGGSFNPVHNGHLLLALQTANEYGYERVLFIPAKDPPHKFIASGAREEDRWAMLNAALDEFNDARFIADDCELRHEGVSYTIDTVRALERRYKMRPGEKLGVIIGSDLCADFGKWKEADLLAEITDILLGRRAPLGDEDICGSEKSGWSLRAGAISAASFAGAASAAGTASASATSASADDRIAGDTVFPWPHKDLHNDFYVASSAKIRRMIAEKKDWKSLVPSSVYRYIVERNLYGFN